MAGIEGLTPNQILDYAEQHRGSRVDCVMAMTALNAVMSEYTPVELNSQREHLEEVWLRVVALAEGQA